MSYYRMLNFNNSKPINMKHKFEIGDTIIFKSPTRNGNIKATRKINGTFNGLPTVRFNGWADFVIKQNEILDIWKD